MNTAQLNPHFLSYPDKRRYWSNIITTWYLSGLKMKVFCQTHQLPLKQFRRWFYKLNLARPVTLVAPQATKTVLGDTARRSKAMTFMPVTINGVKEAAVNTSSSRVELIFKSGYRLVIHEGFDEGLLCNVLRVMSAFAC